MSDAEVWALIPSFPEYLASNLGRIKRAAPGLRNNAVRVIKPWVNNNGYEAVCLSVGGIRSKRLVNRLVCEAFHGLAPDEKPHALHSDGNSLNNREGNLRWGDRSENMEDSRLHGTMAIGYKHGRTVCPEKNPRGESHGHAKLTENDVLSIRLQTGATGRALAERYCVSPATICLIRSRKIWSHI